MEYKGIETGLESATESMLSHSKGTNELFLGTQETLKNYPLSMYKMKRNVVSLKGKEVVNTNEFGKILVEAVEECSYGRVGDWLLIDNNLNWSLFMYKTPNGMKQGFIIAPFKGHTTLRGVEIYYDPKGSKGDIRTRVSECHRINMKYEDLIKKVEASEKDVFIEEYFNDPERY